KLRAERWLRDEAMKKGFALTILRLVTIYGPQARSHTLFPVLKRLASIGSLVSRIGWPGLTGLIHVDDAVRIMLTLANIPPKQGVTDTYLAQGEAYSLAEISRMVHRFLRLPYRRITFSVRFWKMLSGSLYWLLLAGKI